MARQITLGGQVLTLTETSATARNAGGGTYYTIHGTPQVVVDFLTSERIPISNIITATFTSNAELCVLYRK